MARSHSGEFVRVQKSVTWNIGGKVVDEATLLVVRFSGGFFLTPGGWDQLAARDETFTINVSHTLSDLLPGTMEGPWVLPGVVPTGGQSSLQSLDSSRTAQSVGSMSNQCDPNGARRFLRFLLF